MTTTQNRKDFPASEQLYILAAQAPAEPPEWFKHVSAPKPPLRSAPRDKFRGHPYERRIIGFLDMDEQWKDWDVNTGEWRDLTEKEVPGKVRHAVENYINEFMAEWEVHEQWKKQDRIDRYFQWRIYFARQIVAFVGEEEFSGRESPPAIPAPESYAELLKDHMETLDTKTALSIATALLRQSHCHVPELLRYSITEFLRLFK